MTVKELMENHELLNTLTDKEKADLKILKEAFEKVKPVNPRILWDIFALYFPRANKEISVVSSYVTGEDLLLQLKFGNRPDRLSIAVDNPYEFINELEYPKRTFEIFKKKTNKKMNIDEYFTSTHLSKISEGDYLKLRSIVWNNKIEIKYIVKAEDGYFYALTNNEMGIGIKLQNPEKILEYLQENLKGNVD